MTSSSIEPGRRVPGIMRACLSACDGAGEGKSRVNGAELPNRENALTGKETKYCEFCEHISYPNGRFGQSLEEGCDMALMYWLSFVSLASEVGEEEDSGESFNKMRTL